MKLFTIVALCLPLLAFAAEPGGKPAEAKEHAGAPVEDQATTAAPAEAHEHGGAPAESKNAATATSEKKEHGGAPAEAKP